MRLHRFFTFRFPTRLSGTLITILLFSVAELKAEEAVFLKNHWTSDYVGFFTITFLDDPNPHLLLCKQEHRTLWYIERVDDNFVRLKTKEGLYLNIEKGRLEVSSVPPGFFSAQWQIKVSNGYHLIINRWTGAYLNTQNGPLEVTTGKPGWWSAQWSMEDEYGNALNAKDFSLNSYSTFTPEQGKYYRFENTVYGAKHVYLDVNPKKTEDLAMLEDYGGDNGGKAWQFTLVSDGWYKISNLKLGGNKVLAVAKNTDGSYYFVLTNFAFYPNQLWRLIRFDDPTLSKGITDHNLEPEKLTAGGYTLLSKQHGLDPLHSIGEGGISLRFFSYALGYGSTDVFPFDLLWQPEVIGDMAAIRNIPLNANEQFLLISEANEKALKIMDDALLKATPVANSPFHPPVGRIKGEPSLTLVSGGRGDLSTVINNEREYTPEEWENLMDQVGKIPTVLFNNTNFDALFRINFIDEDGYPKQWNYFAAVGKRIDLLMSPQVTNIVITVVEKNTYREVLRCKKFYRSQSMKIYFDGTATKVNENVWVSPLGQLFQW